MRNYPFDQFSFGQKLAKITDVPDGEDLHNIKSAAASYIDMLNDLRNKINHPEVARQLSVAITEAQGSIKWAIDALEWPHHHHSPIGV